MDRTKRRAPVWAVIALLAGAWLTGSAGAEDAAVFRAGDVSVEAPWSRETTPAARAGAAFFRIVEAGEGDRLIAASGDVADRVELHEHVMEGDVMKMRAVEGVDVPAHGTVDLAPGGYHVMLIGLKGPLVEGESFPLTITFEKAGTLGIEVRVMDIGHSGDAGGHAKHGG